MKQTGKNTPWGFLDDWRGKLFSGEWPTLPEMFRITVARYPDRPCFTDFIPEKHTLTYTQVLRNIEKLAAWLHAAGVKHGDHVAVSGKNSPEWATVYLATLFAGGTIVPIDYGLHDTEIENLLNTAKPTFFFVDEEKYDYFSEHTCGAQIYSLSPKHADTYAYNLETSKTAEITPASESDTAAILFTSGTTGVPKGVMLTHKNLVSDCYIAQMNLSIYSTDVFYALLPIHHSYTMLAVFIEAISVGAEIVFGKTMAVSRMLKELREGKITMLLGVPLLFNKLLAGILKGIRDKGPVVYGVMKFLMGISYLVKKIFKVNPGKKLFKPVLEKASISTLRIAICGGGPLAPSVFRVYNELGIDFIQGYGLTETSPIIALNPKEAFKIESVGKFFAPYMEMKILDPNEDGIGEVAVKGPMVMQGYYQMPEATAEVFTDDGWFKTGDLGKIDAENYLYLAGRAKNMIVTEGGKNVYPEEIENAFQLYTDIEQITVRGYIMDKAMKSEGIEALVYPSDELIKRLNVVRGDPEALPAVQEETEQIVAKVNKVLQPYARISHVVILDEPLEMTTTKKVKRTYNT
ncbi:AMP-dependent synthetase/ligase [Treponema brennaborense]|uniref:Long-chain-fatty-acid--CoA ligase n=1 Tax=Treponema brennaborense (strain DSM 12168 / CIP 105900 / DD5/3) TaxID=906968 RepID=F4LMY8_TREBD|nr:AMP-binding protein [Treponema brennaborense]AEE15774.1 Long-chain-fatty-acid--CoA ligase [Treponema brennaborense DSM 12168]